MGWIRDSRDQLASSVPSIMLTTANTLDELQFSGTDGAALANAAQALPPRHLPSSTSRHRTSQCLHYFGEHRLSECRRGPLTTTPFSQHRMAGIMPERRSQSHPSFAAIHTRCRGRITHHARGRTYRQVDNYHSLAWRPFR